MRLTTRLVPLAVLMLAISPLLRAQTGSAGVMADLQKDVAEVEKKVLGLAKALPESAWAWRPGEGARSTAEVLMHIAADNYFMPVLMDMPAPAETGITKAYKTAAAFEKKPMARDAVMAELEKSFAFLKTSMTSTPAEKLDAPLDVFGQKSTTRGLWIMTATHLHEHLGQLIAYARSNKVTPPWSK